LLAKTRNVQEVEIKFMQSSEYSKLPTEAEEAEDRSEERTLENEENLETLEEAANDTESTETEEEAAVAEGSEGAASSENPAEQVGESQSKADEKANEKTPDILQNIEDAYQRIRLNVQLDDGGDADIKTASEKKVGGQINIIV
jgi:hypothetical protein